MDISPSSHDPVVLGSVSILVSPSALVGVIRGTGLFYKVLYLPVSGMHLFPVNVNVSFGNFVPHW